MKELTRILSFVLSTALLLGFMPGRASAAAEVKTILQTSHHDGGFQIGTYGDVAAVWENVYYNPATGEMVDDLDDVETVDTHSLNGWVTSESNVLNDWMMAEPDVSNDWTTSESDAPAITIDRSGLVDNAREESIPSSYAYEDDENHPNEWFWRPMYLVRVDEKGLHRISDYYAELTGISETGHAGAKGFCGKWGAIDYNGKVVYDFDYGSIEEMEGYVEPRTTRNTTTSSRKGYISQREDHSNMLIVITKENEKLRAYHNGYIIMQGSDGYEDVMDEKEERLLPSTMKYEKLSDVSDTGFLWAGDEEKLTSVFQIVEAHKTPQRNGDEEYIYDEEDVGEDVVLPTELLDSITDIPSAVSAVNTLTAGMTDEQKKAPTGIDLATLYAETAAMRAACKTLSGNEFTINAALIRELESTAVAACSAVDQALAAGSVFSARVIRSTAVFQTDETSITVHLDPDILEAKIQIVRIETPDYALAFNVSDLESDLTESITISAETVGTGYAPRRPSPKKDGKATKITVSKPANLKLSQPVSSGNKSTKSVVKDNGKQVVSKYNPATELNESKINESGTYTQKDGQLDFSDISNKSDEMQKAIQKLRTSGVIRGTTESTYSPDGSIGRAEIAQMIVGALGKNNNAAIASFVDVPRGSWYYTAAANSQRLGYIKGYEDRTFRGLTNINRVQIISVAARVLRNEMGYKQPSTDVLSKYGDRVDFWAQNDVALATNANLVVYRWDGTFSGTKNMTRGDAAILLNRLFQKLW